jgi:hypothetical protein
VACAFAGRVRLQAINDLPEVNRPDGTKRAKQLLLNIVILLKKKMFRRENLFHKTQIGR